MDLKMESIRQKSSNEAIQDSVENTRNILTSNAYYCCVKPNCNYKTCIAFNLRRHMKNIHKTIGKNIYKCQVCGNLCDSLRSLNVHQTTCSSNSSTSNPSVITEIKKTLPTCIEEAGGKIYDHILMEKCEMDFLLERSPNTKLQEAKMIIQNLAKMSLESENSNKKSAKKYKNIRESDNKIYKRVLGRMNESSKSVVTDGTLSKSKSSSLFRLPKRADAKKPKNENCETRFNCTYCNCSYAQKRNLLRHIKCVHEKLFVCSCNLCKEVFCETRALQDHILLRHSTVRRFYCAHCDYSGMRRLYYFSHMKICNGNKDKDKSERNSRFPNTKTSKQQRDSMLTTKGLQAQQCHCSICGDTVPGILAFVNHMQSHGEVGGSKSKKYVKTKSENNSRIAHESYEGRRKRKGPSPRNKKGATVYGKDSGYERRRFAVSNTTMKKKFNNRSDLTDISPQKGGIDIVEHVSHVCGELKAKFDQESLFEKHKVENHSEEKKEPHYYSANELSIEMRTALAEALACLYKESHLEEDLKQYECQMCLVTCLNAAALESHNKRHL